MAKRNKPVAPDLEIPFLAVDHDRETRLIHSGGSRCLAVAEQHVAWVTEGLVEAPIRAYALRVLGGSRVG